MRDHLPALSRCSMPFQHEAGHLLQYSIRCADCVDGAGEQLGLRAKWKRIWDEHPALENLYLQRREAQSVLRRLGAAPNEASDCTKGASVIPDRLQSLSTDLCMLARNSKFEVCIFNCSGHPPPQTPLLLICWAIAQIACLLMTGHW